MRNTRTTTTALLDGLMAPDNDLVWGEFDARFRPIIKGFAMKLGIGEADAEDVTQEALARFIKYYRQGKYDRTRGKLSSWLISIAQHCVFDLRQSRAMRVNWRGESAIVDLPEGDAMQKLWEEECRRVLFDHAMRELRETTKLDEKTITAFELVVLKQRDAASVAAETGLSVDSVYAAKHRCLTQLRTIMSKLKEVYEV